MSNKQKINIAILTGGEGSALHPLTKYYSKPMLPIAGRPLLEHLLRSLKNSGLTEMYLCLHERQEEIVDYFGDGRSFGLKIYYSNESLPRGTAGCLKDIASRFSPGPILVISGSILLLDVDLFQMIRFHHKMKSAVTVGVMQKKGNHNFEETVETSPENLVRRFHLLHQSQDRRVSRCASGIYVLDSSILELIDKENYVDLKEQLLPRIKEAHLPVYAFETRSFCKRIDTVDDYFEANRAFLWNNVDIFSSKDKVMDRVYVGRNVEIAKNVKLLGPLVIDDDCSLEEDTWIVGPVSIGKGCHLSKGSIVRDSILWSNSYVSENSEIDGCIIGPQYTIPKNRKLRWKVALGGRFTFSDINVCRSNFVGIGIERPRDFRIVDRMKYLTFVVSKRALNLAGAIVGIICCLPLFLLVAFAIKMDSPGPVFFCQRRCGKNGRKFKMIKFRSMVTEAEEIKLKLANKNEVDGPMFKIRDDPRTTRVGRFLRRKNIDELPQLFNILVGDMNFVGPRPLEMKEMKFNPAWRDRRLQVKPGLTGLWQVSEHSQLFFSDWIRQDIYYIENQSLWLDLKILIKTIRWVFKGDRSLIKKRGSHL